MEKIPVLFLCSEEYSKILCVAMTSLLDNKGNDTFYEIYVLVQKSYGDKSLAPFLCLEERFRGFSLNWIEMDEAFSDTKTNIAGVGKETMYRLLAAEVLPEVDRCIYLDSDTLVLNDLTEMYNYDIQDCYIAGIYPERFLSNMLDDYKKTYGRAATGMLEKLVGLCTYDQYIGAGVMIMDLKALRENNMCEKFIKAVKPNSLPKDQDILNTCCYGHIAKLPVKFCIDLHELDDLGWFMENNPDMLLEIQSAFLNPVVVHYSDRFKPWNMYGLRYEKKWWNYASKFDFFETIWENFIENISTRTPTIPAGASVDSGAIYQAAYTQFSRGISYRLGRAITFIPRKMYYFFRTVFKRKH